MYFLELKNKKLLLSLSWRLKQNFFCDLEKLIEYSASAVNVALPNPCVCPLPKIDISLFLLLVFIDELISTPTIMTFLP